MIYKELSVIKSGDVDNEFYVRILYIIDDVYGTNHYSIWSSIHGSTHRKVTLYDEILHTNSEYKHDYEDGKGYYGYYSAGMAILESTIDYKSLEELMIIISL